MHSQVLYLNIPVKYETHMLDYQTMTYHSHNGGGVKPRTTFKILVGVLGHTKYLKAALHSTNVSIGTMVV